MCHGQTVSLAAGTRLWGRGYGVGAGPRAEHSAGALWPLECAGAASAGSEWAGGAGTRFKTQPGSHFPPAEPGCFRSSSHPSCSDPAFLLGVPPAQRPPPALPAPRAPKRFQLLPAAAPFPLPSLGTLPETTPASPGPSSPLLDSGMPIPPLRAAGCWQSPVGVGVMWVSLINLLMALLSCG